MWRDGAPLGLPARRCITEPVGHVCFARDGDDGMRSTLKMPKLGDAVDTVVVLEVLVATGDRISEGQSLFVVETDKAKLEVPSPMAGTVVDIAVAVGDEVRIGAPTIAIES
jgi:pyruvate/2-oxoglutarate dehydrogenase complex dihydrolipoamide acyltransferase (E2) component